ncbi:gas vesicle protein GvpG [Thermomonospora cellulosilytica]|uniref:1,6-anhydro-N-acetylmuramate kinase n=1 Tax=Thermomonospora cellulosilytica TaxID=1411118 RepID=A0A7W3MV84_9ACTN|nr:gas vesicle protein GvpG [Thermomonospora cellulosilytica]MBA9002510.1 1,6-anhydro-N-acetylmuramate kinase [Thermomonospora cellulosilytica]
MNLLSLPWRLPFLPLQGVLKIAEILQEEAERQTRYPPALRRRLEELEQARAAGRISAEEEERAMEEIFAEAFGEPPAPPG